VRGPFPKVRVAVDGDAIREGFVLVVFPTGTLDRSDRGRTGHPSDNCPISVACFTPNMQHLAGVGRQPLRITFGSACLETRLRLDLTQQQVADRVGVSRSYIAKVELGQADPRLDLVEAIAEALGLELDLRTRPPLFMKNRLQRDVVHARCSGYIDRRLVAAGWRTAREVEVHHGRSHGWIDLLAFDPRTGTLLIIEIKTRLDDIGAIERQLGWYERSSWAIARELGWQARRTASWLLLLSSEEVERGIRANRRTLELSFPRRAEEMLEDLVAPYGVPAGARGLALVDPTSRRRAWLIRSRVDGRRSPPAFADYAEAARLAEH
jgi:transcriptional regulator with XRE-family HTH domain